MYIPKTFQLGSRTWRVKMMKDHPFRAFMAQEDPAWDYEHPPRGLCDPNTCTIYLLADHGSDTDLMHTFYHEVMHALLFSMGRFSRKDHDEIMVDSWGDSLAQLMSTMKGENQIGQAITIRETDGRGRVAAKAVRRYRRKANYRRGKKSHR